jgi:DNA helicase HerA-like ATPase
MRILRKDGANILVVASPTENVRLGDYLMVSDKDERSLILQIYDESYLDVSGIEEEVAREEVLFASTQGVTEDPADVGTISKEIRDMRLLHCKARGSIEHGRYSSRNDWMPSRTISKVSKLSVNELLDLVGRPGERFIKIGRTGSRNHQFGIPAEAFDGRVTIITGRKESGKSHLAKMIVRGLVQQGAYCIVFDLNDEYGSIGMKADGSSTDIAKKIDVRRPGRNLKFSLAGAGLRAITSLLQHSLDMTGTSIREFIRIWEAMEGKHEVGLTSLGNYIQQWRCNEFVRDALYSRYFTLSNSGIFYDGKLGDPDMREDDAIEGFFESHPDGGALVISLTRTSPLNRRMTVELVLSKLVELLEHRKIPPMFLLSEEAHLYLRDTYWEDLITRMRHFGVFTTFVTNQPDAIKQEIYRQADNIFLYNFSNDSDLSLVSQASMVDADTVRSIVRTLPPRMCLALGYAVSNLPILVNVDAFDSPPTGLTRLFFQKEKDAVSVAVRVQRSPEP